jgi:predicted nuclease of predicted toxin-antitoxin system
MKFFIDNNLSHKLVEPLLSFFSGSVHVRDTLLGVSADDNSIWLFAKKEGYTILTKDNDFDERARLFGCPPKVVHLICGNRTTKDILNMIISNLEEVEKFLEPLQTDCILKIS